MQQVGETSQAIVEDDEKELERLLRENKSRQEPYWIVIYAKPSKTMVDGKPTLLKYRKAVYKRPRPQVGMITGEVNNKAGTIDWEINMPDKPFGYSMLGLESDSTIKVSTKTNPQAYHYI